jgi:hypothetical protein
MNYRLVFIVWLLLSTIACSGTPTVAPATPTPQATATPQSAPSPSLAASPVAIRTATNVAPSATSTPVPASPTPQTTTRQWNFDNDTVGTLPAGMVSFSGAWAVRAEAAAPSTPNALCQTGNATYPALSLGSMTYTDVIVTTRFKPISGQVDRAAGIIFRVKDKDNFYILRANALEDNVNLYTYIGGQRSTIKEGNAKVPSGQWQELRAEAVGNRLRGFLSGQLVVETTNNQFTAGSVGLWTKADSVTCFDDVTVRTP